MQLYIYIYTYTYKHTYIYTCIALHCIALHCIALHYIHIYIYIYCLLMENPTKMNDLRVASFQETSILVDWRKCMQMLFHVYLIVPGWKFLILPVVPILSQTSPILSSNGDSKRFSWWMRRPVFSNMHTSCSIDTEIDGTIKGINPINGAFHK